MGEIRIDPEFKALIPPLTAEEYAGLEESIVREGCRDALVLWMGILVDGHNRYEICQKHGIPFETREIELDDRDEAIMWIIMNQFSRRNLPAYERARLALRLKPVIAEKAKGQQIRKSADFVSQKSVEQKPIDTQKELARAAGVSHDTIHKVETIEAKADNKLKADIMAGKTSINQAYQQVKRQEKIDEVYRRIDEHEKQQTGVISMDRPKRKYNIIYADPPWKYWESGNKNQELHYKTMTIDDICNIPVANMADDNCVLFMWATYPILKEAFRVIEAWGFNYSTAAFVWVKKNKNTDTPFIGCGSWTRANSEICLLATKGQILRLDASVSQVVESPIEEHSKKPDIVRDLITQLVGKLPRVELFCRHPAEGWDVWGNEA